MRYLVHLFLLAALVGYDQVACSQLEFGNSGTNLRHYPVAPAGLGYHPTANTINSFDLDSDIDRQAQDPLPFMSSEFWDETVLTIPDYHPSLDTSAPGGHPSSPNREDEQVSGMELDSIYPPPSRTEKRFIGDLADQGIPKKHRRNPSPEEEAKPRQRAIRPSQSNSADSPPSANDSFEREIKRVKSDCERLATNGPSTLDLSANDSYRVLQSLSKRFYISNDRLEKLSLTKSPEEVLEQSGVNLSRIQWSLTTKVLMLVEATGQPGSNEAVAHFPYTVAADVDAVPQLNCDDLVNRLRQPKPFSIRQLPLYGNLRNTLDLLLGNSMPVAFSNPRVALNEARGNIRAKIE